MDLIDRRSLLEAIGCADATKYGNKDAEQQHRSYSTLMMYEIADYIEDAPTVDAVPVVRCRDCGYGILDRWHKSKEDRPPVWRCRKTGRLTVPNGFCHRGKIREEDQNATD